MVAFSLTLHVCKCSNLNTNWVFSVQCGSASFTSLWCGMTLICFHIVPANSFSCFLCLFVCFFVLDFLLWSSIKRVGQLKLLCTERIISWLIKASEEALWSFACVTQVHYYPPSSHPTPSHPAGSVWWGEVSEVATKAVYSLILSNKVLCSMHYQYLWQNIILPNFFCDYWWYFLLSCNFSLFFLKKKTKGWGR